MKKWIKRLLIFIFVLTGIILAGFGAKKLYDDVIADATKRIKEGVSKGISKGIGDAINPLKWPGKLISSSKR